jgi:hypothetical protein
MQRIEIETYYVPFPTGESRMAGFPISLAPPHTWPLTSIGAPSESPHSSTTLLASTGLFRHEVQYAMRSQRRGGAYSGKFCRNTYELAGYPYAIG